MRHAFWGALCIIFPAFALGAGKNAPRFSFHTSPRSAIAFKDVSGGPEQIPILDQNGQGVCAIDYNGDGLMDLYFVNGSTVNDYLHGLSHSGALYRNNGDGTFTDVTRQAGVDGPAWGTGCSVADADGDGHPDLLVLGWGGNKLYHNNGNGTFTDVTELSGLKDGRYDSSAAWGDFDGDGRLDVFISRYVRFDPRHYPTMENGFPCAYHDVPTGCPPQDYLGDSMSVYQNLGNGKFQDLSRAAGLLSRPFFRGFGDVALRLFEDSVLPDVYVGCDVMPNLLWRNLGHFKFDDEAVERGAAVNFEGIHESSMGVVAGDVSETGNPDIFVTNFAGEKNTLYRNNGEGFEDITPGTGLDAHRGELGWGNAIADLDNDGHEDIIIANGQIYPQVEKLKDSVDRYKQPMRLYAGDGHEKFQEISVPAFQRRASRRGLIAVDLNNNGRLDIVTVTQNGAPEIFWNDSSPGNHWIRFTLAGAKEKTAMGAKVEITFAGLRRTAWKLPNQGYQSSQDPRVHFGLGGATRVTSIKIFWPDGKIQTLPGLPADADYAITEGTPAKKLTLPRFAVPKE